MHKQRLEEIVSLHAAITLILKSSEEHEVIMLLLEQGRASQVVQLFAGVTCHADSRNNSGLFLRKLAELSSVLLYTIGDVQTMRSTILDTVAPHVAEAGAAKWTELRAHYRHWPAARTHFVTVATDNCSTLQALGEMAEYAGLDLHVLGLGRGDFSWKNKLLWVLSYLKSNLVEGSCSASSDRRIICSDDVIVVIDAYDIALTMAARLIARSLYSSPTPIVFCAEVASFPNQAYASVYPTKEGASNRFLNAGCFLGPVSYVISALEDLLAANSITRSSGEVSVVLADDQYEWTRELLQKPHLFRVEHEQEIMISAFRTGETLSLTMNKPYC